MGRTLVANPRLAGSACAKRRDGRTLNTIVSHHVDTASKIKIRRVIAVLIGTVALVAFAITYFAFPAANEKLWEGLVGAMLISYGYAIFPGVHPGQARWDAVDRELEGKSSRAPAAEVRTEARRDG